MDELAHASNLDPLEFRLRNLSDKRLRAVLQAAAQRFGWPSKKSKEGQGFGIAAGNEKGSYVATCAEVISDAKANKLQVIRLVTAFECGAVVNPDGLRNQVIGANIQGLGGALFEAIRFESGCIKNPRFASYRVPRFRDLPAIEAVLLDRKDIPSAGAGETPIMVGRLDPKSGTVQLKEAPTKDARPYGIQINSKGVPFFCEFGTNKMASIDPSTMQITEYPLPQGARPRRMSDEPPTASLAERAPASSVKSPSVADTANSEPLLFARTSGK